MVMYHMQQIGSYDPLNAQCLLCHLCHASQQVTHADCSCDGILYKVCLIHMLDDPKRCKQFQQVLQPAKLTKSSQH